MDIVKATNKISEAGVSAAVVVNCLWDVYKITGDQYFKRYAEEFHELIQKMIKEVKTPGLSLVKE